MDWKPSKRQALLKRRLLNSSQIYWQTSHQLDQMLLRMLHNNGIYTPDDLHSWELKNRTDAKIQRTVPVAANRKKVPSDQINLALTNLGVILAQLKDVISKYYNDK